MSIGMSGYLLGPEVVALNELFNFEYASIKLQDFCLTHDIGNQKKKSLCASV